MPREAALDPTPRQRASIGLGRRLFRSVAFLVMAFLVVTIAPVALLRFVNPFTSAFMVRAQAEALNDSSYHTQYTWVGLNRISANAALAVIASEDQLFPDHNGFDVESIRKAVESNGRGKRVRGASTISQQVAKNLFLWSGKSYFRKGLEAWFTVLLETLWPKTRILEVYLNIVEFGKGVYGVEAASRKFFHKSASQLSRSEAALLAAVLPNPRRLRVDRPSAYVLSRRDWIQGQMRGLGGWDYLKEIDLNVTPARKRRARQTS
jgi:monofunctional biosynthetic peptidoglycan transglycosylase